MRRLLLLLIAFLITANANYGKQFTIWNPIETTPISSSSYSFKPCDFVYNITKPKLLKKDFLFVPAKSQKKDSPKHSSEYGNINIGNEEKTQLFNKYCSLWKNLDSQVPLPTDQCYTVYLDVRSRQGTFMIGLTTHRLRTSKYGKHKNDQNDKFVGFKRFNAVSAGSAGSAVQGNINATHQFVIIEEEDIATCDGPECPTQLAQNFRINIEICDTTTVEFVPTFPLGIDFTAAEKKVNFERSSHEFDVDLRGNTTNPVALDVFLYGFSNLDIFAVTVKVLPLNSSHDTRNLYSTVMDGFQLDTSNWNATFGTSDATTFQSDKCSGSIVSQPTLNQNSVHEFEEIFCAKVPVALHDNTDYLFDIGLFAESIPANNSQFHSVAIGLKSGTNFVGFNRVGYFFDRLGDVITATADDNGLTDLYRSDRVLQSRPQDGTIKNSNGSANLFNVKIAVYGKNLAGDQQGVSVFAGTPDFPPYSYVWDALGQITFNWEGELDLCVYQQTKALPEDYLTPQQAAQFLTEGTRINGLTFSVEQADYGCDGRDLSGLVEDKCGVCAGDNQCVGCDGKPYSGAVLDACGVCNGTNATCCYNRFGIEDKVWDWLLLPYIIDDLQERLNYLHEELGETCVILDRFTNLCNKNPAIADAFTSVDFGKQITENKQWKQNCLGKFNYIISAMDKQIFEVESHKQEAY